MKKILFALAAIVVICFSSCKDENYPDFSSTQVKIEKSELKFSAAGGNGSIVVDPSESGITATSNETWCKLSLSGNTISVSVDQNINMLGRTALITVKSGEKTSYIPVSQDPVYLKLDSYEDVVFLGKGGNIVLPFECTANVPVTVVADNTWLKATISDNKVMMTADPNPKFLEGRKTKIRVIAGNNLSSQELQIVQGELITSFDPDPNKKSIESFLNLKNAGTASTYRVTYFSARLATLVQNLKTAYPVFKEIRILAPRGTYKLSVALQNVDGEATSFYYWNATNGLVPVQGSNFVGVFAFSGNTFAGTAAPYVNDVNYTKLREFFASSDGFSIFPDTESNAYWFRSVSNPLDYMKIEPATF